LIRKAFITGAMAGLLAVMAPVYASSEKITLNFVNADINSVVQTIGQITGRNFLLDPRVKGTINIVSSRPVPRDQVYNVFLESLRLQGYTTVDTAAGTKIVPEAEAKQGGGIFTRGRVHVRGDRIVTHVFPLHNESATQIVSILRPLSSPNSVISAVPGTNTLVVTDYADNVRRISRIIENLDRPSHSDVVILHLQNASALDLAQMVTRLMTDPSRGGQLADINHFSIVPDTRTNSLLVRSENQALVNRVRQLVISLDVPSSSSANIHVVYLRNASAEKLAPTLRAVLAGDNRTTASTTAAPVATGGRAVTATTTQTALSSPDTGSIQADTATNSLIITAPDNVYNSLRSVIAKLDTRRAQIDIEALIVEVSSDKAAALGIQWQNITGINKKGLSLFGGTNFTSAGNSITSASNPSTLANPNTISNGLSLGLMHGMVNIPGIGQVLNLGMLAQALATDSHTNILSEPNLLTMDNEEASIIIGKNVPFITGSYAQATGSNGAAVNPFQTIERKDVGLSLKVKPQISADGTVKLQISQEVSSIDPNLSNPAGIITDKRAINSTVLVDDGQTIVLGGLMDDQVTSGEQGVPGLSKVPVLGNLFKAQTREHVKTNLMVFLRPRILRTSDAYTGITQDRYDYIRNQQLQQQLPNSPLFPDSQGKVLPPLAVTPPSPQTTKK
jgi:general secretion pathway protein D